MGVYFLNDQKNIIGILQAAICFMISLFLFYTLLLVTFDCEGDTTLQRVYTVNSLKIPDETDIREGLREKDAIANPSASSAPRTAPQSRGRCHRF